MSIILATVLDADRAATLPVAGGFHFLVNIGLLVLGDEESGNPGPMLAFGIASLLTATLAVAINRALQTRSAA